MGLANWLTIVRILLIPVFVTLLVYRRPGSALLVFGAAAITDLLDGWAARHWKDRASSARSSIRWRTSSCSRRRSSR
jgi:phosphatidylglycerophosphate synthase